MLSFHTGTLGFLMAFGADDFKTAISRALEGDFIYSYRQRLHTKIVNHDTGDVKYRTNCINDVVLNRSLKTSNNLGNFKCLANGRELTQVRADGYILIEN